MIILGISRGEEFSPNMKSCDAAIFSFVAENLRIKGHVVECMSEKKFYDAFSETLTVCPYDIVFSMARATKTMELLKAWERCGVRVVNSAFGIENCVRSRLTKIFIDERIPMPDSCVLNLCDDTLHGLDNVQYPCWMKRGDGCAQVKEDVTYVESREDAACAIDSFKSRNIQDLVINEHLKGDLVKFYGVEGTSFFDWGYASDSHSKFGLEEINGNPKGFHFEVGKLKEIADRAAVALNVPVYGGDCVISETGDIKIIDFNDWPSFSRCRDIACEYIAERVLLSIE